MNNQTPYIEYNGETYEFEASLTLKRMYDKDVQKEYRNCLTKANFTDKQVQDLEKIQKSFKGKDNVKIEELDENDVKLLLQFSTLLDNIDLNKIYEKYCFLMLEEKYGTTKEEFNSMLEGLANDYGVAFIDVFVQKVCEKVFTQVEEKKKKALPSWME